jgi:hypothetical protein
VASADTMRLQIVRTGWGAALLCLALLLAPARAAAGDKEDVADLRRTLREVQEQNRELSRRLEALEGAAAARRTTAKVSPTPDSATAKPAAVVKPSGTAPSFPGQGETRTEGQLRSAPSSPGQWETRTEGQFRSAPSSPDQWETNTERPLDVRVKELETVQAANESATRQIIQNSLSKIGPNINRFLALSGTIEFVGSRFRDIDTQVDALFPFGKVGPTKEDLALGTVELDFDIKVNDWLKGALVIAHDPGTNVLFPTTIGTVEPVDRFALDRTHILIGDETQFPISARFAFEVLHFGTSTGVARLDTLSIGTPLTTEVFENRQTAAGLEFALPTPPLRPPPAPVVIPPVRPLVLEPLVSQTARWLGYTPLPQRVMPPVPVTPPVPPPPFYGSIMFYKGREDFGFNRTDIQDFNASLGFRTQGHCGRPYEELRSSRICPWTLDTHVDYSTNVFESIFLQSSYRPFLNQIGSVPGIAWSLKAGFGPFALVGEVNSAIEDAVFFDGPGTFRSISPMTWQVALAYQFDWNPWVQEIGAQGNFLSVAYSGSEDMAGVIAFLAGVPTRVGFVPEHRLFITAGEWVMPELKVAVEYSTNWDYSPRDGGTGGIFHGIFGLVQLNF